MVGGFAFLGSFPRVGFCVVLTWESWVNVYDDADDNIPYPLLLGL
jgi:hypothetical protein